MDFGGKGVVAGGVKSHNWARQSLEVFWTTVVVFNIRSQEGKKKQTKLRGRRERLPLPPSCQLNVSLRSHCGGQENQLFLTNQFVRIWVKRKNQNTVFCEREEALTREHSSFFLFFLYLGFMNNPNTPSEIPSPVFLGVKWNARIGHKKKTELEQNELLATYFVPAVHPCNL